MAEIVKQDDRHQETLEKIKCLYCGSTEFTEIRFEGLYCQNCNAEIEMRLPAGDDGSIVTIRPNKPDRRDYYTQKFLAGEDEPHWTGKWREKEDGGLERVQMEESEEGGLYA